MHHRTGHLGCLLALFAIPSTQALSGTDFQIQEAELTSPPPAMRYEVPLKMKEVEILEQGSNYRVVRVPLELDAAERAVMTESELMEIQDQGRSRQLTGDRR